MKREPEGYAPEPHECDSHDCIKRRVPDAECESEDDEEESTDDKCRGCGQVIAGCAGECADCFPDLGNIDFEETRQ